MRVKTPDFGRHAPRLTALVLMVSACACAVVMPGGDAHAQSTVAKSGSDAATKAEWRKRWGYFADIVDVPYVVSDAGIGGRPDVQIVQTAHWEVPGEVLVFTTSSPTPRSATMKWDATAGRIVSTAAPGTVFQVQPDGSIHQTYSVSDQLFLTKTRLRDDGALETIIEKGQGGSWVFFNRMLQVPTDKLADFNAANPIPTLEAWVGKKLVSAEAGRVIQLNRGASGPWALDIYSPDGQWEGRFEMGAAKPKLIESSTQYELTRVAMTGCDAELPTLDSQEATVMSLGGLPVLSFRWSCGKRGSLGFKGARHFAYSVRPIIEGLQVIHEMGVMDKRYQSGPGWEHRYSFVAATDTLLARARDTYAREMERTRMAQEAAREERRERNAEWSRRMGAISSALGAANEVASASEAESRAALDASLAAAEAQRRANQAQPVAPQPAPAIYGTRSTPATSGVSAMPKAMAAAAPASGGPSSGAPLRFVLSIGLQPRTGDRVNPTCYSNVITRPGPPGWRQERFLPASSSQSAYDTVQSFKARFISACKAASGRDVTSEGNFQWTWNETPARDQQVAERRARASEDVTVDVD